MDRRMPPAFGDVLHRYREAAGLTQEDLAERTGLSREAMSALERGARRRPHPYTVRRLAETLRLAEAERARFEAAARAAPADAILIPAVRPTLQTPALPLIGRAHEIDLLERHLGGEGPPVLLLAGEPGIGKTRLLQQAAHRAHDCGWRVLEGGCQRRGGQDPYAPLLGTLKSYVQRQDRAHLRTDLQGCAWLVRLLPELAEGPIEPLPAWTLPPEQERRLVFEAVERYLANVAGPLGTLLMLDDLQWAGADALDLLVTLARSTSDLPLRVIGAYRDTEVQAEDPLSVMLADLAHAGLAGQHTLGPLAPQEAGQLVDALLDDGAADRAALRAQVLQRTGGVPFFVVSCAQVLRSGSAVGGTEAAVPWTV